MTFPLTHPDTGAVYEALTADQAEAMSRLGWQPATKAEHEKAARAAVQAERAAYEALHKAVDTPRYAEAGKAARPTTPPSSGSSSADPTTTEA